jgi:hypothetical protein
MWALLDRKSQATIVVTISILLLVALQGASEFVTGKSPSPTQFTGIIVFVVGTVCLAAFNWAWRWIWKKVPVLEKIIFPDLNGTWDCSIQTNWKDPKTNVSPGPIDATVWIRQSLLTITVRQQTKESPSWSTRMFPYADVASDRYLLWFSYDNRPHANVASLSPDHEGVCWLEMSLNLDRNQLRGQYYTSRSTSGNMQLKRISRDFKNIPGRAAWSAGQDWNDFRL